ncbi:MAG: aminotransferase class I/II-fold pyridoxal phosphate-dependent enzyme, partial [Phycisphaeraceae bacterium]|nr:aminotransferase class I/II-fold pyridoxal phosphate-dependent enzyme [Phycisphaeraceae bacterium]
MHAGPTHSGGREEAGSECAGPGDPRPRVLVSSLRRRGAVHRSPGARRIAEPQVQGLRADRRGVPAVRQGLQERRLPAGDRRAPARRGHGGRRGAPDRSILEPSRRSLRGVLRRQVPLDLRRQPGLHRGSPGRASRCDRRGVCEHLGAEDGVHARVGTFSKALGSIGGFVVGQQRLIDWLANRARSYVFSTAPPEATSAAGNEALRLVQCEPHRRVA